MKSKKVLALLLACLFLLSTAFAGCGSLDDEDIDIPETDTTKNNYDPTDPDAVQWSVYWYLCGSDLESNGGAATADLQEMLEVTLPENVQVVIQTGGAAAWQNELISADKSERYIYNSEGLFRVEQNDNVNMGDPESLRDFLNFCETEYPAEKTAVVFWNHGGGSVSGAAFDENYNGDSLTLDEFRAAFASVYGEQDVPPVEMVGFDTCLMATIDTAYTFSPFARYMTASEEYEPGGGWLYSGWLQALADNPTMDGAELGKHICDTYIEGCEMYGVAGETTLSVVDLTKIQPLLNAYENMGTEALTYALQDSSFFSDFSREASRSENYGGNTDEEGYTNMVDLGHLASNCADILPEKSKAVLDALDGCVVYKVNGPYRSSASGLSCYYSYNCDIDDLYGYNNVGYGDSFKYFYTYGIEGELDEAGIHYIKNMGYVDDVAAVPDFSNMGDVEYPLYLDNEGFAIMEVTPEMLNVIKDVSFYLIYLDDTGDYMLMLGQDNELEADWENGVFRDQFYGNWGAIDGHYVCMEILYEEENYTMYSVPILLNGVECNLRVIYDYTAEAFSILGARKAIDENGMSDKNLIPIKPGDEITTIHIMTPLTGEGEPEEIQMETFTVTEQTQFHMAFLGEGEYLMFFELTDIKNNTLDSQFVSITIDSAGEISVGLVE